MRKSVPEATTAVAATKKAMRWTNRWRVQAKELEIDGCLAGGSGLELDCQDSPGLNWLPITGRWLPARLPGSCLCCSVEAQAGGWPG